MKSPKIIIVDARRWFEKTNGNTYHSVSVTIDFGQGLKKIGSVNFAYGYGEHYLFTAFGIMKEFGLFKDKEYLDFLRYKRENQGKIYTTVTDVSRKKDL